MKDAKCHPPMMEFCHICGEWAGPELYSAVEWRTYKQSLLTFDQVAAMVESVIDRDTLNMLVNRQYIPSDPYFSGYFRPLVIADLRERLKNSEVIERLAEWKKKKSA
jgi:hypothetical protein